MKRYGQFFLFFIVSAISYNNYAQEGFEAGSVIQGDTLYGKLKYQTDEELSSQVLFIEQSANDEEVKTFEAGQLEGFGFGNDRVFHKFYLRNQNDSSTVYAKKVLTGKIDLWLLRKGGSQPDFFLKNNSNGKFVHIRNDKKRVTSDQEIKYVGVSSRYIGLIKYVTDNDTKFNDDLEQLKYSENKIIKAISEINAIHIGEYSVKKYEERVDIGYRVLLGGFYIPNDYYAWRIGVIRKKSNIEKSNIISSFRGMFLLSKTFEDGTKDFTGRVLENERNFQVLNVIPFGLNIQAKNDKLRPYLYVGAGLGIINEKFTIIDENGQQSSRSELRAAPSLILGSGLQVKVKKHYLSLEFIHSFWVPTVNLAYSF